MRHFTALLDIRGTGEAMETESSPGEPKSPATPLQRLLDGEEERRITLPLTQFRCVGRVVRSSPLHVGRRFRSLHPSEAKSQTRSCARTVQRLLEVGG